MAWNELFIAGVTKALSLWSCNIEGVSSFTRIEDEGLDNMGLEEDADCIIEDWEEHGYVDGYELVL